jgi:hypothetical protein
MTIVNAQSMHDWQNRLPVHSFSLGVSLLLVMADAFVLHRRIDGILRLCSINL